MKGPAALSIELFPSSNLLTERPLKVKALISSFGDADVGVVVLNWNRPDDTLACLRSVRDQRIAKTEVVLVDNGSNDNSVLLARQEFPEITIIETGSNLGYAAGNNVGIKYCLQRGFEFILVLNNDTLLDKNCVFYLLSDLRAHKRAAAVAPKSFYSDRPTIIYYAGGEIDAGGATIQIGLDRLDRSDYDVACETQWLTGCAILIRAETLQKIGLFEEKYFLMFEDSDWSLRARRNGYVLRFVPAAKLWHKVSASFGSTWSPLYMYYYSRNSFLWLERNFSYRSTPRLYYKTFRRLLSIARAHNGTSITDKECLKRALLVGVLDYTLRKFGKRY